MDRSKSMYTIAEAAEALELPETDVRQAVRDRVVAAEQVGGRWVIPADELEALETELTEREAEDEEDLDEGDDEDEDEGDEH